MNKKGFKPVESLIAFVMFLFIGVMFFIEKLVTPVIIDVLAELGVKSSTTGQRPNPIIDSITGYAAQLKPIPPKKRGLLWRLRHWRH